MNTERVPAARSERIMAFFDALDELKGRFDVYIGFAQFPVHLPDSETIPVYMRRRRAVHW